MMRPREITKNFLFRLKKKLLNFMMKIALLHFLKMSQMDFMRGSSLLCMIFKNYYLKT